MDEATTEATEQTEEVEGSGPKQLRDALKREKEKNARLTSIALGNAFKQVGLNPEKGLGKAIAKEYEGDPTAEGVAEYAKTEYDWEVPEGTVNAEAAERRDKQATLEAVESKTVPVKSSLTPKEAEREAQEAGDFDLAGRIKAQRLAERMNIK